MYVKFMQFICIFWNDNPLNETVSAYGQECGIIYFVCLEAAFSGEALKILTCHGDHQIWLLLFTTTFIIINKGHHMIPDQNKNALKPSSYDNGP